MEQEKIGKFILQLRKEKNMTQKELAEKLGVTDRAISKWENGRGMPELSLIKPLCEILDVPVNELLSGERLVEDNYQQRLEENILNTIDYANKKMERRNRILLYILITILLVMCIWALFNSVVSVEESTEEYKSSAIGYSSMYCNESIENEFL